jgi:hypothetical protein
MALSDQQRASLERLPSLVKPLLTLANAPHPFVATATFAYGVLLRILQLGSEIREAVAREGDVLDAQVRADGLFRVPLDVDLGDLEVASFVELGRRRYPRALEQLADDVRVLDDPRHPDRKGARERLAIARTVIPRVYDHYERTGELRHPDLPLLSLGYLQLLNPGEPHVYRALVANLHLERTMLFDGDLSSATLLRERVPAYVQAQLRVERQNLDEAKQQALDRTIDSVRELYWGFVFGDGQRPALLEDAMEFLVERAGAWIDDERSRLAAERERLVALPADERDEGRLADVRTREEELSDLGRRLREGRP